MRVLILGGSGHMGSLVVPLLAQQHQLTIFDRRPPVPAFPEVAFVEGDVSDGPDLLAAMKGQEAILYLAMGVFGQGMSRPDVTHVALTIPHQGFDAVFVVGARERVNLTKAKELLGWEPNEPKQGGSDAV